jgi:excisionase family DNA binding protein
MKNDQKALTVTVPQAARLLGIGRNLAYECVKRGDIPTIQLGRRILVPLAGLNRLLSEGRADAPVLSPRVMRRSI